MANINDTYFDGYYKDIWKTVVPAELTVKEVEFMLVFFKLQPASKVLDLMCGYGRHAIALAQKGIRVTAVDNLKDYTDEIREQAVRDQLPLEVINSDVISYNIAAQFDLVLCMGNSLNFFNAEDTTRLLKNISAHLKPGGQLFINTWSLAEIVFKNFQEKGWSQIGELKFLNESSLLFHPTRIETTSIMLAPGAVAETKTAVDYIFSINEMETMLNNAGLTLKEIDSIPGKKPFRLGAPRAYLVAQKV